MIVSIIKADIKFKLDQYPTLYFYILKKFELKKRFASLKDQDMPSGLVGACRVCEKANYKNQHGLQES